MFRNSTVVLELMDYVKRFPHGGVSGTECELSTGKHPACDINSCSVSIYSSTFHSVLLEKNGQDVEIV